MNVHSYSPTGYSSFLISTMSFPFFTLPFLATSTVFPLLIVMFPVAFSGNVTVNIMPSVSVTLMSCAFTLISESILSTVSFPVAVASVNESSPEYATLTSYSSGRTFPRSIVEFKVKSVNVLLCFLPLRVMFTFPVAREL